MKKRVCCILTSLWKKTIAAYALWLRWKVTAWYWKDSVEKISAFMILKSMSVTWST